MKARNTMSDNKRMQQWLQRMEEGNQLNPKADTLSDRKEQVLIHEQAVYIPKASYYVGFWKCCLIDDYLSQELDHKIEDAALLSLEHDEIKIKKAQEA